VVTASTRAGTRVATARAIVAVVPDPEVPVLTIDDLGVLRDVEIDAAGTVHVAITPTYSGCPAMDVIRDDVLAALHSAGFEHAEIKTVLSPAWTTDWMSAAGKAKLRAYGIAPPPGVARAGRPVSLTLSVRCPQCDSLDTREVSHFGSTACKSLWVCTACAEPFDHFKAI
jgi:ring-1,2-phenylacetyl-CoA epoxidase subunit PaaD